MLGQQRRQKDERNRHIHYILCANTLVYTEDAGKKTEQVG